jgi:phosphatidylglycerophosphate synthase
MLANWITLSRFPVLLLWIVGLYFGTPPLRLAGVAVLFLGLMLDTVDGMVARRTGQTSLLGSVLDIAADRSYELALWVCFADLGLVPAAIPIIVVVRTTLTDALRSVGIAQGTAPFAQVHTPLGRFLVESAWMRTGYSVAKVTAFCGLALAEALSGFTAGTAAAQLGGSLAALLQPVAWLAVIFCVGRGLPVMASGLPRLRGA